MKRIIKSAVMVLAVVAVVAGATYSFFSDTETSTGNTFTAGSIDLKVDHVRQTYNGVDCKTCSVDIKSDTTNQVVANLGGTDPGPFPHNAVLVTNINLAWTASVPTASWIWWTDPTPEAEKNIDTTYTFRKTFPWMGPISGATLALATAADNGYEVRLNGFLIGSDPSEQNYNAAGQDLYTGFSAAIVQGTNILEIKVKNMLRPAGQTWDNPGGLLYRLTINGNCDNDSFKSNCKLWGEKDLAAGDTFFDFRDVKPGDLGTNVISLHAFDNDAYACMYTKNNQDDDNGLSEPEAAVPDGTPGPTGGGELSQYLQVFAWRDLDGDGIYEPSGETGFGGIGTFKNIFIDGTALPFADSLNGTILSAGTQYIGLAWCAGTLTVDGGGNFACDASGMGNIAQTDSLKSDVVFYATQVRNNGGFKCSDLVKN